MRNISVLAWLGLALSLGCDAPPEAEGPPATTTDAGEPTSSEEDAELVEASEDAIALGVHFYRTWPGDTGEEVVFYDDQERELGRAIYLSFEPVDAVSSLGVSVRMEAEALDESEGGAGEVFPLTITIDGEPVPVGGEMPEEQLALLEYHSTDINRMLVLAADLDASTLEVDTSPAPPESAGPVCRAGRRDVRVRRMGIGLRSTIEGRATRERNRLCRRAGGCCAKGSDSTLSWSPGQAGFATEYGAWIIRAWGTVPGRDSSRCGSFPPRRGNWCGKVSNKCGQTRTYGCPRTGMDCRNHECRVVNNRCRPCPSHQECGLWDNRCGVTLRCGVCGAGKQCRHGTCQRGREDTREEQETEDEDYVETESENQQERAREEWRNDSDDNPGSRPCAPGTSRPYPGARCV